MIFIMPNFIKKIWERKFLSLIIILALAVGGYYGYKYFFTSTTTVTTYTLASVQKGTVVVSVSGSGQVSASNQVDIKPKASGDIAVLNMKNGQAVKSGALLAQLDTTDAQKAVRDAQTSLETAQLALDKLNQPADALSLLQAENSLTQTQESKQSAESSLEKAYDDAFNAVSNAFIDLPGLMSGLVNLFYAKTFDRNQQNVDWYANEAYKVSNADPKVWQYRDGVNSAYDVARESYDKNFDDYKTVTRNSDEAAIESILSQTYNTTKNISDAINAGKNFIDFFQDLMTQGGHSIPATVSTQQSSLNSYLGTANGHLSSLLSLINTIKSDKNTITATDRTIADKTASLAKLREPPDALDVRSQELSIQQKKDALTDAKAALADYYIRAPFDGTLTNVDAKKGDSVSSGTALATLLTEKKIAEISLNEVDVAQVKVGQKATLTFDAVSDLSISGEVAEIDSIGTVSQGVVTYAVKIGFDTQNERVKPSMSVSAVIITEAKIDVLTLPNAAVKSSSSGSSYYVEILDNISTDQANKTSGITSLTSPRQVSIQIGLVNDLSTEITVGLKEGDRVVTQTVAAGASNTTTTQTQSSGGAGLRIPGVGGGFR